MVKNAEILLKINDYINRSINSKPDTYGNDNDDDMLDQIKYSSLVDDGVSFSQCQDDNMGINWFNNSFQKNWITMCDNEDNEDDKYLWSNMKCSVDSVYFKLCLIKNVYVIKQRDGSFKYLLRVNKQIIHINASFYS